MGEGGSPSCPPILRPCLLYLLQRKDENQRQDLGRSCPIMTTQHETPPAPCCHGKLLSFFIIKIDEAKFISSYPVGSKKVLTQIQRRSLEATLWYNTSLSKYDFSPFSFFSLRFTVDAFCVQIHMQNEKQNLQFSKTCKNKQWWHLWWKYVCFFNHANGNQLWYVQSNREWRPNKMDPDKQARIDKKVAIMAQRVCQSPEAVGRPKNLKIRLVI